MTYKQIEASRERRLWLVQVVLPAIGFGWMAMQNPEINSKVKSAARNIKQKIKDLVQKR
ncbi:hypothetical protein [Fibrobacter sp.]|uniref:hypothetical protein n=1 Tax=Fibrobacter sp. TaxID=35828 RepID=UPI00388CFFC3